LDAHSDENEQWKERARLTGIWTTRWFEACLSCSDSTSTHCEWRHAWRHWWRRKWRHKWRWTNFVVGR